MCSSDLIKVAEMKDEMQNLISKTETDRIENEKIKEDLREHSETITHGRISLSKATAEYDAANETGLSKTALRRRRCRK